MRSIRTAVLMSLGALLISTNAFATVDAFVDYFVPYFHLQTGDICLMRQKMQTSSSPCSCRTASRPDLAAPG